MLLSYLHLLLLHECLLLLQKFLKLLLAELVEEFFIEHWHCFWVVVVLFRLYNFFVGVPFGLGSSWSVRLASSFVLLLNEFSVVV